MSRPDPRPLPVRQVLAGSAAIAAACLGVVVSGALLLPDDERAAPAPSAARPRIESVAVSETQLPPADRPLPEAEASVRFDPAHEAAWALLASSSTADAERARVAARVAPIAPERVASQLPHLLDGAGPLLEAALLEQLAPLVAAGALDGLAATALLAHVLERSTPPESALAAGRALDALGASADPARLEQAWVAAPTPAARLVLLRALALAGRPRVLERALREDPSAEVRGEALELLATADPARALEFVVRALDDPRLQRRAARLLARLRGAPADEAVAQAFLSAQDPATLTLLATAVVARARASDELRAPALGATAHAAALARALGQAPTPPRVALLRAVLARGASDPARVEALRALVRARALPLTALHELARVDPSSTVRRAALQILSTTEES